MSNTSTDDVLALLDCLLKPDSVQGKWLDMPHLMYAYITLLESVVFVKKGEPDSQLGLPWGRARCYASQDISLWFFFHQRH